MKIAISLPDVVFEEAERTARSMGIPRSQLFARAVSEYIKRHQREQVTAQLNRVYEQIEGQSSPEPPTEPSLESIRELTKNDTW